MILTCLLDLLPSALKSLFAPALSGFPSFLIKTQKKGAISCIFLLKIAEKEGNRPEVHLLAAARTRPQLAAELLRGFHHPVGLVHADLRLE